MLDTSDPARTRAAREDTRRLRRGWRQHRERMSGESDYPEAFVAVVRAGVKLATESHRVRHLVREGATAYVAVLRALPPHTGGVRA